ncbi:hypothetical protein V5O48_000120 [Marasmius crinis-equi]|uniref:BTB domain-containing protein n=1 Tax=Marasmius crinis-equi TaxID=585013 RepID=A0ABR3G229_9AGAR
MRDHSQRPFTDMQNTKAHEECTLPTDIAIRSSDGRRFGAHARNLEFFSEGLVQPNRREREDIVISEPSDIIFLLLQFMHNLPQPDLRSLPFELLSKLSSAAQKYGIHNAIGVCKLLMEKNAEEHPFEVYMYASRAGFEDIREKAGSLAIEQDPLRVFSYAVWANEVHTRDKAALATVHLDAEDIIYSLSRYYTVFTKWHHIFVAWVKFRDHIYDTFAEALRNPDPQMRQDHISGDCPRWNEFYCKILVKVMNERPCTEAFDDAVDEYRYIVDDCAPCNNGVERWRVLLAASMSGGNSSFSSFVKSSSSRD